MGFNDGYVIGTVEETFRTIPAHFIISPFKSVVEIDIVLFEKPLKKQIVV